MTYAYTLRTLSMLRTLHSLSAFTHQLRKRVVDGGLYKGRCARCSRCATFWVGRLNTFPFAAPVSTFAVRPILENQTSGASVPERTER